MDKPDFTKIAEQFLYQSFPNYSAGGYTAAELYGNRLSSLLQEMFLTGKNSYHFGEMASYLNDKELLK